MQNGYPVQDCPIHGNTPAVTPGAETSGDPDAEMWHENGVSRNASPAHVPGDEADMQAFTQWWGAQLGVYSDGKHAPALDAWIAAQQPRDKS